MVIADVRGISKKRITTDTQMIRILTFTTLYPNREMPQHGVFVENRLRNLVADTDFECKVFAPMPWFPFSRYLSREYHKYSEVKNIENRYEIDIFHPKYFHLPLIGMNMHAISLALSSYPKLNKIIRDGYNFDLIDAHYFYPDGVAAVILAKMLNKPVVVTARGSDLNVYTKYFIPRRLIKWSSGEADALITVCQALKNVLLKLSDCNDKVTVIRNGVDLNQFVPALDRDILRKKYGLEGKVLLMVGRLVKLKGHHLAIQALANMKDTTLLIAGEGTERASLESLANELGLKSRVRFMGAVPHKDLSIWYSVADALLLVSSSEGWANVILESMACGTPVVATDVGGTSEIIQSTEAGVLIEERSPEKIVAGVKHLFENYPDRQKTRNYAEKFSWFETSLMQRELFMKMV